MTANPLWWENMAAGSRHDVRIGKLGEHIFNSRQEGENVKRKYREAINSQRPPPGANLLQQGHTSPALPNSAILGSKQSNT